MKRLTRLIAAISVIAILAGMFMIQASSAADTSLNDIDNHWAKETIEKYINMGYINGYPDGMFRPDGAITRAEFVSLVNKVFLIPSSESGKSYNDIAPGDWYYSDVMSASADGYITGYENGAFRPNSLITRQEACVVIYRLLSLPIITDDSRLIEFSDIGTIAAWSKSSIVSLIIEGIVNGYSDKTIRPNANLTRAEAICLMDRALDVTTPVIDFGNSFSAYLYLLSTGIEQEIAVEMSAVTIYSYIGNTEIIKPHVYTKARGSIDYLWEITGLEYGSEIINGNKNNELVMTAPYTEGEYSITLVATNAFGISSLKRILLIIDDLPLNGSPPLPDEEER